MAVIKFTTVKHSDGTREAVTSHAGMVLRRYTGDIQYMSDVYGTALYADVFVPSTDPTVIGFVQKILVDSGWSGGFGLEGECEVDADFGTRFAAALAVTIAQIKSDIARSEDAAFALHNEIVKGKRMRTTVTRGKNANKEGIVFWIGGDAYGVKVGLALSDKRDDRGRYTDVVWVRGENGKLVNAEPYTARTPFSEITMAIAQDFAYEELLRTDLTVYNTPWTLAEKLQNTIYAAYVKFAE